MTRVSILCNNLSGGSALAGVSLGMALRSSFDVEVIGCQFGDELWPSLREVDLDLSVLSGSGFPGFARTATRLVSCIRGDVIIAHQIRLPSFGLALVKKFISNRPVILYVDDDDIGLTMAGRSNRLRDRLRAVNGDLYTRFMHRFLGSADAIFCGSDYFSERLGGTTAHLGRDAELFDPSINDRDLLRSDLGITDEQTVVGFIGMPREHAGFDDLIAALDLLSPNDTVLLVAPPRKADQYTLERIERSDTEVRLVENAPSSDVPRLLRASDLVVAPQRINSFSQGQLPARVVEAMAMAKPIITTRLSDIPRLLGDGGIYIDERDPEGIAAAIMEIRTNPEASARRGAIARDRFLQHLSLNALADQLSPVINNLANSTRT